MYTCTTQRGYSASVRLVVTNNTCPVIITADNNVILSTKDNNIGTQVLFSCPVGYNRTGQYKIIWMVAVVSLYQCLYSPIC